MTPRRRTRRRRHSGSHHYDLLFKVSAETMTTIAADPRHLGAKIAITSVLHTWGSAITHHPHVHMIVPGGGISTDGSGWIARRPNFLLPVMVLSKLFRRLMLERLTAAHAEGLLSFQGAHAHLADAGTFADFLAPLKKTRWSSTPSARSPGPRPCSPTCRATPIASPYRTAV